MPWTPPNIFSVVSRFIKPTILTRQSSKFSQAIVADPNYAEPYVGRGFIHKLNAQTVEALSDFNEAIRLDPHHADAYEGRGSVGYLRGQFHESIADYTAAIRCGNDHADVYHSRAMAFEAIGELSSAIEDYQSAIQRNPHNPISQYFLANSCAEANSMPTRSSILSKRSILTQTT